MKTASQGGAVALEGDVGCWPPAPTRPGRRVAFWPGRRVEFRPVRGSVIDELQDAKQALRRQVLTARAGLTGERRTAAGRALRDAVLTLPQVQMAGTVAAYYSVGTEPAT